MKKTPFIVSIIITIILELSICGLYLGKITEEKQDPVAINECLKSVEENYGNELKYKNIIQYSLIDKSENLLYINGENLSTTINAAIKNGDTLLDVYVDNKLVGKMIFANQTAEKIESYKTDIILAIIIISVLQAILAAIYFIYMERRILKPFARLNSFAYRVASGNLDIPLEMDRKHVFGNFTEAFDLMRSELKKARLAEKKANDEKKEVIAKLSHDIKTPVASIKSTSEIGYELSKEEKIKNYFNTINVKSDQITTLVDNLFNSSINDITEIAVSAYKYESKTLKQLIVNSDYLKKAEIEEIPKCMILMDKLRMQQAFDNVFMNSYKYANTPIQVCAKLSEEYLVIRISDQGPGVLAEELPLLKEKYKRGSNIKEKEGAGLGLYLTNYFLENMDGKLELANLEPGFAAIFYIRTV